jgi:hypothetical protein
MKLRCVNKSCGKIISESEIFNHLKSEHPQFWALITSTESKEMGFSGQLNKFFEVLI